MKVARFCGCRQLRLASRRYSSSNANVSCLRVAARAQKTSEPLVNTTSTVPSPSREERLQSISTSNLLNLAIMVVAAVAIVQTDLTGAPVSGWQTAGVVVLKSFLVVAAWVGICVLWEPQIKKWEEPDLTKLGDKGAPEVRSYWQSVDLSSYGHSAPVTPDGVDDEAAADVHFQTRSPAPDQASERRPVPANAHLYHGFGANLWSWQYVHQSLADYFGGTVAAHDQQGFGLTQRTSEFVGYETQKNGLVGIELLDLVLRGKTDAPVATVGKEKILIAHSLGCTGLLAALAQQGTDARAIMLVDPVVQVKGEKRKQMRNIGRTDITTSTNVKDVTEERWTLDLTRSRGLVLAAGMKAEEIAEKKYSFAEPLLTVGFLLMRTFLQLAFRSRQTWSWALSRLVKAGAKVPDNILLGYRIPVIYPDWEAGIMLFFLVQISSQIGEPPAESGVNKLLDDASTGEVKDDSSPTAPMWVQQTQQDLVEFLFTALLRFSNLPVSEDTFEGRGRNYVDSKDIDRVQKLLQEKNIKLIVVTGEKDQLARLSAVRRLTAALSTPENPAPLLIMKGLGHTPHEEDPSGFMGIVREYL